MKNITFWFGAGASANCLPTYGNFSNRFSIFVEFMNKFNTSNLDRDYSEANTDLLNSIKQLQDEFIYHNTPDTIAKKYFHTNKQELLRKLKIILILFFVFEQDFNYPIDLLEEFNKNKNANIDKKDKIDKRYDAFIASVLKPVEGKLEFLEGIKILSWNYDIQLEKAYSNYAQRTVINIQKQLQSLPDINGKNYEITNYISVIHLNGLAYAETENLKGLTENNLHTKIFSLYYDLNFKPYFSNIAGGDHLLNFAWENLKEDFTLKENNNLLENALEVAKETNALVICGYSFPIFNRAIDIKLLEKMSKLEHIFLQTPSAKDVKPLLNQILKGRIEDKKIEDLGYWNQFHLPEQFLPLNVI